MKTLSILILVACTAACVYSPERDGRGYRAAPAQGGQERVLICHKGKQTMELPASALNGHMNHGDRRGAC